MAIILASLAVLTLVGDCGFDSPSNQTGSRGAKEAASGCDPNYAGACLDPNAYDYDCEGGSGNGPDYTGTVTVTGEDHYGLDADGDGIGCEPY